MYALTEDKVMSIIAEESSTIAEYLDTILRILVVQALKWIYQKYVIVLQFNAEMCSMYQISWGLFYINEKYILNKVRNNTF